MLPMFDISLDNTLVDIRMIDFQPGGQGWPQVITYKIKVAMFRIGTITFSRYFFIIIGKGSCPRLYREYVTKGIFSRWLIKMTMNTKVCRSKGIVDRHWRGFLVDHHYGHLPGLQ